MSVQASRHCYCTPQENEGPYINVEVWGCHVPTWTEEYGDGEFPYAYVPIELVSAEIDKRGGFAKE